MVTIDCFKDPEDFYGFYNFLDKIKQLSPITIEDYIIYYRHFDISKLSQEYVDTFCLNRGNNSVVRGMLLNYLEYKKLNKVIELPPKPKGHGYSPQKMPRAISWHEINVMLDHAYAKKFKYGLLIDLTFQGALRRSEIKKIALGDFDWDKWVKSKSEMGELKIHGKGNKERIVLVNPETMDKLMLFLIDKKVPTELFYSTDWHLFLSKNLKTLISNNGLRSLINRMAWESLNRTLRPHELRFARAKDLEARGINIKDIKNYLGHTHLTTTEIYLHSTTEESLKKIKNNLNPDQT
jgi:site-specific recombinase XerD